MASAPDLTESPATLDLRYVVYTLYRRKFLILMVMLTGLMLAVLAGTQLTPQYRATADVLVQPAPAEITSLNALMLSRSLDPASLLSEVELVTSQETLNLVIERLDLINNPLVNTALQDGAFTLPLSPDHPRHEEMSRQLLEKLREMVRAAPVSRSYVIRIEASAPDASLAGRLANTTAEAYIDVQFNHKLKRSGRAAEWLGFRLQELKNNLLESEQTVEEYNRLMVAEQGQSEQAASQQIALLAADLVKAQASHAAAVAKLEEAYAIIDNAEAGESAEALAAFTREPALMGALAQRQALVQRRQELSGRFGPRHPAMIAIDEELKVIRNTLADSIEGTLQALEAQARLEQVRELSLRRSISRMEEMRASGSLSALGLRQLEREMETQRRLFESFLERYKDTLEQDKLQSPDARLISPAVPPSSPVFPNFVLIISLSLAASLLAGLTLAFTLNALDSRFHSIRQVIDVTRLPVIGVVPKLPRTKIREVDYVLQRPYSAAAEAIRMIRTSISLLTAQSADKKEKKIINITSSVPGEGKSTLAVWLGRMTAKSGLRAIVIDCDIRNPTLHKIFPAQTGYTLHELLSGSAHLSGEEKGEQKAIAIDQETGLHLLYGHKSDNTTLDLVNSSRMRSFLEILEKSYDLIILDAPPSLGISDGRELARLADTTLYVVKADEISREAVLSGLSNFKDFGLEISGIVLTHVRMSGQSRYEYFIGKYAQI